MCGILFRLSNQQNCCELAETWDDLVPLIKSRGPTSSDQISLEVAGSELKFFSSVLSLRLPFTAQPIKDGNGDVLQFNGELYGDEVVENDTFYLLSQLQTFGVVPTLRKIRGEYAFVYYDKLNSKMWFSRDCIGRRSLLYAHYDGGLFITSVPPLKCPKALQFQEVAGGSVMCLDIATDELSTIRWSYDDAGILPYPYGKINTDLEKCANEDDSNFQLERLLKSSLEQRLLNIPNNGTRISILFSGGLDCTLLALIIDEILPPGEVVDLLNVAFENKRTGGGYATPDRKLGKRSWAELEILRQDKQNERFRFVEINIPFDEMLEHRQTVQDLMWPKDSVMDLSIALAFYFASRAKGTLHHNNGSTEPDYTSPSKVLISGLGADELFGGYSRHTSRLQQNGYALLAEELQLDFDRLHERNLGRDDRVCATWGKELRYPFLDENLVAWAMENCNIQYKVQQDVKDMDTKYILRLIARRKGLAQVSLEKKRAIQFGARSAKMEVGDRKIKGHQKLTEI